MRRGAAGRGLKAGLGHPKYGMYVTLSLLLSIFVCPQHELDVACGAAVAVLCWQALEMCEAELEAIMQEAQQVQPDGKSARKAAARAQKATTALAKKAGRKAGDRPGETLWRLSTALPISLHGWLWRQGQDRPWFRAAGHIYEDSASQSGASSSNIANSKVMKIKSSAPGTELSDVSI